MIMFLEESEVEARFVRASRASKIGRRFGGSSSGSGVRREVRGRIAEFVE
jgi:hypothetical protein